MSVLKKSKNKLAGKAFLRYVVFPVFLGPQRKADCPGGSLTFKSLGTVAIKRISSRIV
jgi:hypothetical protein